MFFEGISVLVLEWFGHSVAFFLGFSPLGQNAVQVGADLLERGAVIGVGLPTIEHNFVKFCRAVRRFIHSAAAFEVPQNGDGVDSGVRDTRAG